MIKTLLTAVVFVSVIWVYNNQTKTVPMNEVTIEFTYEEATNVSSN